MDRATNLKRHKIAKNIIWQIDAGHFIKDKENPQTLVVPQHLQLGL